MTNEHATGLHIVRVVTRGPNKATMLWIAATPRDQAVAAIKTAVPHASLVELTDQVVTKELAALHKLRPGDVSELSSI